MTNLFSLIAGLLFGLGMVVSQMVDPAKVIGFLNLLGDWDPSLALVMAGAIAVFAPSYHLLIKPRQQALSGEAFCLPESNTLDKSLVLGSAIFGVGWGMLGLCPGPALTSISGGNSTIILFVIAMVLGQALVKYWPEAAKA